MTTISKALTSGTEWTDKVRIFSNAWFILFHVQSAGIAISLNIAQKSIVHNMFLYILFF